MGKRLFAAVAAVAMIAGALWWRYREPSARSTTAETEQTTDVDSVICPSDLIDACRKAAAEAGVTVEQQDVTDTLNAAAPPPAWVTLSPLPEAATFGTPTEMNQTAIASSPLTLVVLNDRSTLLTTQCGTPVEWVCLGKLAGTPWADAGGQQAWGSIRPGVSNTATAVGAVSAAAAVTAYFDGRSIDTGDTGFISWARQFARSVPTSTLSAGTAAQTIQVRSSTLDIAAGTAAELAPANEARFDTVPVGDDTTITVVLATSPGARVPDKFVNALRDAMTDNGWDAANTVETGTDGGTVRAALAAWEEMQ